jgi:hypothetical protein
VIFATAVFVIALAKPQSPAYRQIVESLFHNWIAMGLTAGALVLARCRALGPLPSMLRLVSGVLLPVFVILTALGLLIWSPFWEFLRPFGVIEKDIRPEAIMATMTIGVVGCGLLVVRALFRWVRGFGRKYEHSGLAIGFGPLYFFFRRRRMSH